MKISLKECPRELSSQVCEVLADLGLEPSLDASVSLSVSEGDALTVSGTKDDITVTYSRRCELFRALSMLRRFRDTGEPIRESAAYETLCYMIDESRNAVTNMKEIRPFIRTLAALGYDSMMLYTEDTFELPGYEYFGHMRGRYTERELREIDEYASSFGIEVIPCVQTLAHLAAAIRWPGLGEHKDNADTLLVGDERTYDYVRAVLAQCRRCFRSDRIHIGMDEAVGIGRGRYMDLHGYVHPLKIMTEHLARVRELCIEHGYRPMMWSDTFFREAFGNYYVKEGEWDREFLAALPRDVDMVYWDYYHDDTELLDSMMRLHRDMGCRTVFAGGGRKWDGIATNNTRSLTVSRAQLDYCDKYGVRDVIITAWGDCTAEASIWSAMPTAILFAERGYRHSATEEELDLRSREVFELPFESLIAFDLPNRLPGKSVNVNNAAKYLLFNDPLERLMDCHMDGATVADAYRAHARTLHALEGGRFGYAFRALALLCDVLAEKSDLGRRLYAAYTAGDRKEIAEISASLPRIADGVSLFLRAHREQWYRENKTFGFAAQELRLGGLRERLLSIHERLEDYLRVNIDRIEELEYAPLPHIIGYEEKYVYLAPFEKMFTAAICE